MESKNLFADRVSKMHNLKKSEIIDELPSELNITLVGDINTGKSSTINMLIGNEEASVGVESGQTIEIGYYKYDDKVNLIDTPGLDDIDKKNSLKTLKEIKRSDVILFFLNASGTVLSNHEKESFNKIYKKNKNVIIVLNKIDAIPEEKLDRIIHFIHRNTSSNISIVAISATVPMNIEELHYEIYNLLKESGKDIVFAKDNNQKGLLADKWIYGAGVSAGGIGAIPIPGADILPLTTIQVGLLNKLSKLYDKPLSKQQAKNIALVTLTGNLGKAAARQAIKIVPGYGAAVSAGVAGALTIALGKTVKKLFEEGIELDSETIAAGMKTYFDKNN